MVGSVRIAQWWNRVGISARARTLRQALGHPLQGHPEVGRSLAFLAAALLLGISGYRLAEKEARSHWESASRVAAPVVLDYLKARGWQMPGDSPISREVMRALETREPANAWRGTPGEWIWIPESGVLLCKTCGIKPSVWADLGVPPLSWEVVREVAAYAAAKPTKRGASTRLEAGDPREIRF